MQCLLKQPNFTLMTLVGNYFRCVMFYVGGTCYLVKIEAAHLGGCQETELTLPVSQTCGHLFRALNIVVKGHLMRNKRHLMGVLKVKRKVGISTSVLSQSYYFEQGQSH